MEIKLAENIRSLRKGRKLTQEQLAAFFDAFPSYDESDIRFVIRLEGASAHDDLGATSMDGIDLVVNQIKNDAFTALWKFLMEQEEHHE